MAVAAVAAVAAAAVAAAVVGEALPIETVLTGHVTPIFDCHPIRID